MTGFAARRGQAPGHDWAWKIRSVNGKGLDLRLKLPDWIDGLVTAVRAAVAKVAQRGNVTLGLRVARGEGGEALRINAAGLDGVLAALVAVRARAEAAGLPLAEPSAAEILALRGVADPGGEADTGPLLAALLADLDALLADFAAMRAAEGRCSPARSRARSTASRRLPPRPPPPPRRGDRRHRGRSARRLPG